MSVRAQDVEDAMVRRQTPETFHPTSTKPVATRYGSGRRHESSPYLPPETFNEDACCRFDYIAVCYCRVRPGFRTCGDRTGSHRSGDDAGARTQDDEARAQGESPRDAQEGGVIIHGLDVEYQNPASAGFFALSDRS